MRIIINCTDTSTSSEDSGLASSPEQPEWTPVPEQMSVPEPLELTPVPEPLELTPVPEPLELTPVPEPLELTPVPEPLELTPVPEWTPVPELMWTPEPDEQVPGQTPCIESLKQEVIKACPDIDCDHLRISPCHVTLEAGGLPTIHSSKRSWSLNYPALSFMMNGQLFSEYSRITGMLGSHL